MSSPLVKLGAWLPWVMAWSVRVNVWGALESCPPLLVPPLSRAMTVTVTTPVASVAPVN